MGGRLLVGLQPEVAVVHVEELQLPSRMLQHPEVLTVEGQLDFDVCVKWSYGNS